VNETHVSLGGTGKELYVIGMIILKWMSEEQVVMV
jgi:hypothetical protein